MNKRRTIMAVLLGIVVAVAVWITVLGRDTIIANSFQFNPFHSFYSIGKEIGVYGLRGNLFGNIILFIPVGFFHAGTFCYSGKKTILFGLCIAFLIEASQMLSRRGYFEVDDLIWNTIGTGIGCLVNKLVERVIAKILVTKQFTRKD